MMMLRSSDDHSLVEACRAGRTEAFSLLVQRYQGRLYPTIARLVGSADDAEDVLQDAFVRAFEKLDQFQGDSSFYTWIHRIAVNLALSGHRRRRVRSAPLGSGIDGRAVAGAHPADESAEADPSAPLERAEPRSRWSGAARLDDLKPEHPRSSSSRISTAAVTRRSARSSRSPWARSAAGCTAPVPSSATGSAAWSTSPSRCGKASPPARSARGDRPPGPQRCPRQA